MEYPKRKHPRLKEYDYSQNGAYFVTICTKQREKLLCDVCAENVQDEADLGMDQIRLSEIGRVCQHVLEDIPKHYAGVLLDCYMIMPDHIHLLLMIEDAAGIGGQGSGRPTLQTILHAFKRLSSRQAGADLWQTSFYEHVVRNEMDLHEIRRYILGNPVTWELNRTAPQGS